MYHKQRDDAHPRTGCFSEEHAIAMAKSSRPPHILCAAATVTIVRRVLPFHHWWSSCSSIRGSSWWRWLATDTSDQANRSSRTLPHDRRGRKYSLIRRAGKPVIGLELGMDSLDFAPAVDGGKVRRPSPSAHPGKRESGSFAKYWIAIRGLFLNIG